VSEFIYEVSEFIQKCQSSFRKFNDAGMFSSLLCFGFDARVEWKCLSDFFTEKAFGL
jgi:hypothetical protein